VNRASFLHNSSQPDAFAIRILTAEGYFELGMLLDAAAELEEIEQEKRSASEVLALRLQIYSKIKMWVAMQAVARVLALRDPDNVQWTVSWAYATCRADSIEAARIILLNAVDRQPNVAIYHYNLACYECLLGDLEVAKAMLQHALKLEPRYRLKALDGVIQFREIPGLALNSFFCHDYGTFP
jgi:Flp pilus assembly protein TadD